MKTVFIQTDFVDPKITPSRQEYECPHCGAWHDNNIVSHGQIIECIECEELIQIYLIRKDFFESYLE
jgi:hypothetical protein